MSDPDQPTILLVEDDRQTRAFLADHLCADGCDVHTADSIAAAWRTLGEASLDLAIVDLCLPDGSGFDLVRRVRGADGIASRVNPSLPLIILSGRGSELDRLRGFERGADDFVVKPFSYTELLARVRAVLRRVRRNPDGGRVRVGDLELDPAARDVRVAGQRVTLSQKEYALLRALAGDPTRVYTKDELLRDVWGFRSLGNTRTLDSHACRLRAKLGAAGGRFVVNVWGIGYRLVDGPVTA